MPAQPERDPRYSTRQNVARKIAATVTKDLVMTMSIAEIEAVHEAQERIEEARRNAANVMRSIAKEKLRLIPILPTSEDIDRL